MYTTTPFTGPRTEPRSIIIESSSAPGLENPGPYISTFNCTVTFPSISSNVSCIARDTSAVGRDCAVNAVRRESSLQDGFSTPLDHEPTFTNFTRSVTEILLPSIPFIRLTSNMTGPEARLYNVAVLDLIQSFNAYWSLTLDANYVYYGSPGSPRTARRVTTARGSYVYNTYGCNYGWLAVLMISNLVLLAINILGSLMRIRTLSPDILGSLSTLTRDNPHVADNVPAGGTTLDGLERSRLLFDVRVRLEDVKEESSVGHVALGSHTSLQKARNLSSTKLYQ